MNPSNFDTVSRFLGRRLSRRQLARAAGGGSMAALAGITLLSRAAPVSAAATPATSSLVCAQGDKATWQQQMDAYTAAPHRVTQTSASGRVSAVIAEIPPITFTGDGQSATLPVGPCQSIYRYKYLDITTPGGEATPFKYVEIDWNTEGEPRGPNGSFSSAHFDFHFYMLPRADLDQMMTCVSSNGKTCDPFKTAYAQTRRFQDLPGAQYIPSQYRPDIDSAIPEMGLHMLDMSIDYTVDKVNHYPTLIYGTFDGKIVFAESSVTLYTLQDAKAAADHRVTFPFRQPTAFAAAIDWPTRFVIEYLPATGGFTAGFAGFVHHNAGEH